MKKTLFLNVFVILGLMASFLSQPLGVALAAPEWTCNQGTAISLTSPLNSTHIVHAKFNYTANVSEVVDVLWGDNTPAMTLHASGDVSNTTTVNASHSYGDVAGAFTITLRVWDQAHDAFTACTFVVSWSGCAGAAYAIKLSPLELQTSGPNSGKYKVTATSYYSSGSSVALGWGDGVTDTLPSGNHSVTPVVSTHYYTSNGTHNVMLVVGSGSSCTIQTTVSNPLAVTLSDMHAVALSDSINWTMVALGLLGAVVLGQLGLFAIMKRR